MSVFIVLFVECHMTVPEIHSQPSFVFVLWTVGIASSPFYEAVKTHFTFHHQYHDNQV